MSLEEFGDDLIHFRLGKAEERAEDYIFGTVVPEIAAVMKKAASDEWKMMAASVKAHIGDLSVTSPTDSFVKVVTEVAADIVGKAPGILLQDIFIQVNAVVASQAA